MNKDANAQYKYLEALLPTDPWKVITRVENKKYNCDNSDCLAIYKRALEERAFRNQSSGGNRRKGGEGYASFQTEIGMFAAKALIFVAVGYATFAYILPKFIKFENITNSKNDFTGEIPKETFDDVAGMVLLELIVFQFYLSIGGVSRPCADLVTYFASRHRGVGAHSGIALEIT